MTAAPFDGVPTSMMVSPSPVSLAKTLMVTGVSAGVVAVSFTAFIDATPRPVNDADVVPDISEKLNQSTLSVPV